MTPEQQFRLAIEKMPDSRRREAWEAWKAMKAVNAETLEALREMVSEFDEWAGPEEPSDSAGAKARNKRVRVYESARAAISKAEESA